MRAVLRPLALVMLVACTAGEANAQPGPGGSVNILAFQSGSPSARSGGVDVAVTQKPGPGYKCIKLTIRIIDNATGTTLATHSIDNPPESVSKSFTDLGANKTVQVAVATTFAIGDAVEAKRLLATVTTK